MDPRPSQLKAVRSMVLDHGASDFCLKICNLALEANLALYEMKPGSLCCSASWWGSRASLLF